MQCVVEVESKFGYFVDRLCDAYEFHDYEKSESIAQTLPTPSLDYVFPNYNEMVYDLCHALKALGILFAIQDIPMSAGSKTKFGVILHTA